MNVEDKIPNINKYLKEDFEYVEPDELSKPGLCVPQIVLDYGNVFGKIKAIPFMGHYMIGCVHQILKSYRHMHDTPPKSKNVITQNDLTDLKEYISKLGVDKIGFTKVDNSLIFSNRKILYQNAIVLIMEMKKDKIHTAPSIKASKEIFRTYYKLGIAVNKIKSFLFEKGYAAQAGPALGGEVHYPSLAQKAGIGYVGKHGLLINENLGPSLRIAAVYTNIENLPYTDKNERNWVEDFCQTCNRCVKKCPAQAIYQNTKTADNGSKEYIDYKKCAVPFSDDNGCSICIKECIFFKSPYQKIHSSFIKQL